MSFDNVRLPAAAIADLYRQSLVVLDDVHQTRSKNKLQPMPDTVALPPTAPPVAPPQQSATPPITAVQPPPAAAPPAAPQPQPAIHYTGGFGKKISVVFNQPAGADMPAAEQEMLYKLMIACKLVPEDFAVVNVAANQPVARELWRLMPARAMLLLGVAYEEVGIPFTQAHFQVKQWNEAWFLSSPPLSQLIGPDTPELKALKRELWNGLQKIFLGK